MHDPAFALLTAVVVLALIFDFINGFHDTASTIATSIATRALNAKGALILSAAFNFAGAFWSHKVAGTIATGVAAPSFMDLKVIISALAAAIVWNLVTWYFAAPSSSSHALIAALFGAAAMKGFVSGAGLAQLNWPMLLNIAAALFTSPLLGFIVAFTMFKLMTALARLAGAWPNRVNRGLARWQVVSAALISFSHGGNDAQKAMGMISLALFESGYASDIAVPLWVTASCACAISLGVMAGGWRIINTVANKITTLQPAHGFCAEISSAGVVLAASYIGMPVSTTHVAVSAVVGVGASKASGRMHRGVLLSVAYAWITTIPASAAIAGGLYFALVSI
ncbi:MAG: inorganic phosphate transporter [Nitrospinae bacterium]|nr:inorganic phosphate transporter [Nitrospinota bacterium]